MVTAELRNGTLYWSDDATWAGSTAAGGELLHLHSLLLFSTCIWSVMVTLASNTAVK
jgi:hypothetical protein